MDEATANMLAELRMAGVNFASEEDLRKAGVLHPPGTVPPVAFGMPDLSILRGQGAIPGRPLQQQPPNPLANYPQARQPGEGWSPFLDRQAPELAGPFVDAGKAAAMTAAPGLSAFALGMMPTPAGGQTAPSEATRRLQQDLKDKGYFPYKVDGIGGDKTDAANARYQSDQRAAKQLEIDAALAQGKIEEGRRLKEAADRKAAEESAGAERLKKSQEGESWLEQYGPYAGYPMGFLAAMFGRGKLAKMQTAGAATTAQEADAALASAGRNVNRRVGELNAFYERGGGEVPFNYKAGQRPYPWETNPAAGSATDLYQRGTGAKVSPFVATAGGGGLEWGASHYLGVEPWKEELAAAQKAVEDRPTEANIQRLERARQYLAGFETLQNFGRAATFGAIPAEIKAYATQQYPRPNLGYAESERGALDRLVNPPPKKRRR